MTSNTKEIAILIILSTAVKLNQSYDCNISVRRSSSNCTFNLLQYEAFGILQRKSTNPRRLGIWARYSAAPAPLGSDSEIYHPGTIHELDKTSAKLLVPVPLLITCSSANFAFIQSCEFVFGRQGSAIGAVASPIPIKNFTILNQQSSALFLEEGSTTLRKCNIIDCPIEYQMNPNQQLTLNIMLPKQVGSECLDVDDCGPADLYECKHESCQCRSDGDVASIVIDQHGRICSSVNDSDVVRCHNDPTQCRSLWCDGTERIDCLCPYSSNKVRRSDGKFICELNEGSSCQRHKSRSLNRILKCPPKTQCVENECKRGLIGRSNGLNEGKKDFSVIIKTFVVVLCIILIFVFIALAITICKLHRRTAKGKDSPLYPSVDQDSVISKVFSPLDDRVSTHSSDFSRYHGNLNNFNFATIDRRVVPQNHHFHQGGGWFTPNPVVSSNFEYNMNEAHRKKSNSCTRSFNRHQTNPCPPWCMASDAVIAQLEKTLTNRRIRTTEHRNYDEGYVTDQVNQDQSNNKSPPSCPIVERLSNGDVTISA